jgi:hypothetical protein
VRVRRWVQFPLLAICCSPPLAANGRVPCAVHPTQPGWHVYVDATDRFCFEYPPQYQRAPTVTAPGVSGVPATEWLARLATKPQPMELAIADDEDNATINVIAHGTPFHRSGLTAFAPTGMQDIPPKLIHTTHQEFYYYGPGGGGVDYPDSYYFELRGRTFSLTFIGPFEGDKTPAAVTKQIEPKLLASFRRF